ncbi:hypothetical protein Acr_12g0010750 [Actinidia rufa]|uniref:Uncharacterized protein n=1 Tax=Actinidia rufa TaxID=165716 RepID=A0A7J0FIL8_9ERIC|nr:hypothetical protein Acr_12g0010750 [Actinidia rufa]
MAAMEKSPHSYLPTAPMVYAVVADPTIVDNPYIRSYGQVRSNGASSTSDERDCVGGRLLFGHGDCDGYGILASSLRHGKPLGVHMGRFGSGM